jgi:demethylmenaquinone methyltransferase/2-methoxy-6-polyprenyl-1,4-benzoquinol methylase
MAEKGNIDKPKAVPPHPVLVDYYTEASGRPEFVRRMFDRSAPYYDPVNRLFSFGFGDWYRRRCLRRAGLRPGMRVLDAATGTGAVAREAIAIQGQEADVIGLDASDRMLREARRQLDIPLILGRMEQLPIADGSIDFLSIGYALRHVPDLRAMFAEVCRVLRPGGILLVLEIGLPRKPAVYRGLAAFYLGRVAPGLASLAARTREARTLMQYYWDTTRHCVPESTILRSMADAGLSEGRCTVEFGLFRTYIGRKS